jgi:hypothetical protein
MRNTDRASSRSAARRLRLAIATLAALLLGAAPSLARGGGDDDGAKGLKLRLNDAIAAPGGTVALVVRTYAARPIRQGRITVKVRRPAGAKAATAALGITTDEVVEPGGPLTFLRAVVFSRRGDAVTTVSPTPSPDGHTVRLDFSSRTATINAVDGPLAVLFFRLSAGAVAGERFVVEIDPALTGLTDRNGAPLALEPIAAELVVRRPGAPYELEAEGDEVEPGEIAELGVTTAEPFPIAGGRLVLRYDPAAAAGAPVVTMDSRYGKAAFVVDHSVPGRLVVAFQSPDASLNGIPGRIVAIDLKTRASAAIGWETPVTLDPTSWLRAKPGGRKMKVRLENGSLAFED